MGQTESAANGHNARLLQRVQSEINRLPNCAIILDYFVDGTGIKSYALIDRLHLLNTPNNPFNLHRLIPVVFNDNSTHQIYLECLVKYFVHSSHRIFTLETDGLIRCYRIHQSIGLTFQINDAYSAQLVEKCEELHKQFANIRFEQLKSFMNTHGDFICLLKDGLNIQTGYVEFVKNIKINKQGPLGGFYDAVNIDDIDEDNSYLQTGLGRLKLAGTEVIVRSGGIDGERFFHYNPATETITKIYPSLMTGIEPFDEIAWNSLVHRSVQRIHNAHPPPPSVLVRQTAERRRQDAEDIREPRAPLHSPILIRNQRRIIEEEPVDDRIPVPIRENHILSGGDCLNFDNLEDEGIDQYLEQNTQENVVIVAPKSMRVICFTRLKIRQFTLKEENSFYECENEERIRSRRNVAAVMVSAPGNYLIYKRDVLQCVNDLNHNKFFIQETKPKIIWTELANNDYGSCKTEKYTLYHLVV